MPVRRPLVSRALDLPDKGEPQRKAAMLGYGMLASAVVFTGTFAMQRPTAHESGRGPARTTPDAAPREVEPVHNDVVTETPGEGRVPTFFDGQGGIAGVELTEEQRKAVTKEALRRGMTKEQAHDLAYGEAEPTEATKPKSKPRSLSVTPPKESDGKEAHVLASGPMYREVAPTEDQEIKKGAKSRGSAAARESKGNQAKGKHAAPSRNGEGKHKLTDKLDAVIPDPVEELVGDLLPFRLWMAHVAEPGTEPTWGVEHDPEEDTVTVTAESQMADSMTVTVEVTAPVEQTPDAPLSTVSVTVTNPQTDEVTVATDTETAVAAEEVPRVAIGEVVEAVISARQGDGVPGTESG
ncbi:hypothetical protein GCM10012285_21160 [Streptomyces kronopolitis]|uniref:Uncharacterized protein n=1 Tax=Streptomyces kronopolitis TaxID=1612435 RepID=A0ABQ2J7A9_9ACTN|nr:hypothetical protein [Streptomyces kronopolitis]GGN41693.1 hypothetical protein GCM10012285_21160 [Streptomyces kronopolitis]